MDLKNFFTIIPLPKALTDKKLRALHRQEILLVLAEQRYKI